MTVYLVISLPKIPYIHRIYMFLANPNYDLLLAGDPLLIAERCLSLWCPRNCGLMLFISLCYCSVCFPYGIGLLLRTGDSFSLLLTTPLEFKQVANHPQLSSGPVFLFLNVR